MRSKFNHSNNTRKLKPPSEREGDRVSGGRSLTTTKYVFVKIIRPRVNGRFVNRPYKMTKVSDSIYDGGSKPPPYRLS